MGARSANFTMSMNPTSGAVASPKTFTQWRENWQCLQHIPKVDALGPALFQNNPALELVLCIGHCAVLVADLSTHEYAYVSGSVQEVLGQGPETFYEQGTDYMRQLVTPADQPLFDQAEAMHQQFLDHLSPLEKLEMRTAFDFHLLKPNGQQVRILHQATVLSLDNQQPPQPRYVLLICNDITQWKPDGQMVLTIHSGEKNLTSHLPGDGVLQETEVLSRREKEILRGLAAGLRSNELAAQMFISPNTVEWHRKNVLKKLGARSSSEAVRLGLTLGLI